MSIMILLVLTMRRSEYNDTIGITMRQSEYIMILLVLTMRRSEYNIMILLVFTMR